MMAEDANDRGFVRVARLADLQAAGQLAVQAGGHTLALFIQGDRVYAVDNRCPHMGFPLDRGTVQGGILVCHWHHARFDLAGGGTFDPWAGDVQAFPAEVRDADVWVDLTQPTDQKLFERRRLEEGLQRDIPLLIAKAVIALVKDQDSTVEPFRAGIRFGTQYRQAGWGQGLTVHTCMMNLLPGLEPEQRPRALYHGICAVARDSAHMPPRFVISALPGAAAQVDLATLKRWFRRFVEVRDAEGAERCIVSAVRAGAGSQEMADILFAAATDHRYLQSGHVLDFTNKALEALDHTGWEHAEQVLASLVPAYAHASRMEESNAWRYPLDLVSLLERTFDRLTEAYETGLGRTPELSPCAELVTVLLGDDPQAIVDILLGALREGCPVDHLAAEVAYAAALRIGRFHTSNELGDWDTALHTFTFANAVHQGLRRIPTLELVRGIFDAAISIYLDRFLNIPAARLPEPHGPPYRGSPDPLLAELSGMLDRRQQVDQAGELAARYLFSGGQEEKLMATLGTLLLREDRDFHTIQAVEAALQQVRMRRETETGPLTTTSIHLLVAATRYLAAHAPTLRAQGQTYSIASRLHGGERLYEGEDKPDGPQAG